MATEFVLGVPTLANRTWLTITEAEYDAAVDAKEELVAALATEEAFDAVLTNLLEFEEETLGIALRDWIGRVRDWDRSMDELYALNRRLLNFLAAARQMLDHLPQRVGGSDSATWRAIQPVTAQQYDGLLGYRVMSGVRNHHQHRSFALRHISTALDRVGRGDGDDRWRGRCTVAAALSLDDLRDNEALKAPILEELEEIAVEGKWVDAKPLVREYVEGLGKVQEAVRAELGDRVDAALKVLNDLAARWKSTHENDSEFLFVVERRPDKTHVRKSPIHFDLARRYGMLQQKNRPLGTLSSRYVSSEVVSKRSHR